MSEWIRHRGSKSMPKCLEGKRFEVRCRSGHVISGEDTLRYNHDGRNGDIMAYRILGDITPPDYSKGFPAGTTAKDIGAKVGDEFVLIDSEHYHFEKGEVITLAEDDGTDSPFFYGRGIKKLISVKLHRLAPIPQKTAIELQAEEVGIPEPVQLVDDEQDAAEPHNKYQRTIKGVTVDVYDVLAAFGVTCQARGHAIKKLLMAGKRGHKDEVQDLREAVQAIERSIQLVEGK